MKRVLLLVLLAFVFAGCVQPRHRERVRVLEQPQTEEKRTEVPLAITDEKIFYGGLSSGISKVKDWCGDTDSCDDKDQGFKLFGGVLYPENIGVEIAFVDIGEVTAAEDFFGLQISGVAGLEGYSFSGVGVLPVAPNFDLFAKGGIFHWKLDIDISVDGAPVEFSDKGTNITFGVGGQLKINERFGLRAEWERFQDIGRADIGDGDVDLISVGALVYF